MGCLESNTVVAVIGLGYVGLPLAIEFGKRFRTIGYDLSPVKVTAYRNFHDPTDEVSEIDLRSAIRLNVTSDPAMLRTADFLIVSVPTPVDQARRPDFSSLIRASETVGHYMKREAVVIYESTVYPGATEEICVPVLERCSGMIWRKDFHVAYSPERINPGDKEHTLTEIIKVVAGDDSATTNIVAELYGAIVRAGVYRAPGIKIAEAAKVIENIQRDLNVALMNELAIIFDRMDLDTQEVLKAASTKWNFAKFTPGLVGGHCISVDPYYLTYKAEMLGYHPEVILAGRRINDGMGKFIAERTVKLMIQSGINLSNATVNVLGLTFKENCKDLRNSRVPDIINELKTYGITVHVHDPMAEATDAMTEYGVELLAWEQLPPANSLVVAVSHEQFCEIGLLMSKLLPGGVVVDVKSHLDVDVLKRASIPYWRL